MGKWTGENSKVRPFNFFPPSEKDSSCRYTRTSRRLILSRTFSRVVGHRSAPRLRWHMFEGVRELLRSCVSPRFHRRRAPADPSTPPPPHRRRQTLRCRGGGSRGLGPTLSWWKPGSEVTSGGEDPDRVPHILVLGHHGAYTCEGGRGSSAFCFTRPSATNPCPHPRDRLRPDPFSKEAGVGRPKWSGWRRG